MPRDPDDVDEVLGQVSDALDELEVVQGAERDALLESLRGVLGSLDLPLSHVEVRTFLADDPEPPVSLLQGGRPNDAPDPTGPRPSLRLAEPEDVGDPDSEGAGAFGPGASAHVRLLRPKRPRADDVLPEPPGQIRLAPAAGAARAVQPIFQGRRPRSYRVRCVEGQLYVEADGHALAPLGPGQTVDVEAQALQVWSDAPCEGRYIRLRS